MNLRNATRLLLIMGTLLLLACSKEDPPEPDYSKVYLLKKAVSEGETDNYHTVLILDYEYDTAGRIIKTLQTYPFGSYDSVQYQYIDSTLIMVIGSGSYHTRDTLLLELNNKGLMITEHNITFHRITRYTYDEDGYCVFQKSYEYGADTSDITVQGWTITYTYMGGNLVKEVSSPGYERDYSYYDDKVNTLGNLNKGMAFKGKSSKNLAKAVNTVDYFDSLNRLQKRKSTISDWEYEYEYY